MKKVLMIEVSPRGEGSASRAFANTLTRRLTHLYPSANPASGRDHPSCYFDEGLCRGD